MEMRKAFTSIAKAIIPSRVVRQRLNRNGRGSVLLTFDDGPDPDVTPRVLDLLDRWNAKAIFFIPGTRVKRAPHLLGEILERGHQLGNHTFSHVSKTSICNYGREIGRCQQLLHDMTGQCPRYFRPPKGKLTLPLFVAAKCYKLNIVHWSFDTGEYSCLRDAKPVQLAENLARNIKDREIVMSHDDTEKTPEMLKIALPQLVERGFDLTKGVDCLE